MVNKMLLRKLDAILSDNIPLSTAKTLLRLQKGIPLRYSTEIDHEVDGDEMEDQFYNYALYNLPEELRGGIDIMKYKFAPIDQANRRRIKHLLDQEIILHDMFMHEIDKCYIPIKDWVSKTLSATVYEEYQVDISPEQILAEEAMQKILWLEQTSIRNGISKCLHRLLPKSDNNYIAYLVVDDNELFELIETASNKINIVEKEYSDQQRILRDKIAELRKAASDLLIIETATEDVSSAYSEWFDSESGKTGSQRIAPKELIFTKKLKSGKTRYYYVVISRSSYDLANEYTEDLKTPGDRRDRVSGYIITGSLIAYLCRTVNPEDYLGKKVKIIEPVGKVMILPYISRDDWKTILPASKDDGYQKLDKLNRIDIENPNWILSCQNPIGTFPNYEDLRKYIVLKWNKQHINKSVDQHDYLLVNGVGNGAKFASYHDLEVD